MLISARRVGPTGKAIGLDMTDEMLELARANAAEAGVENVEFLKGYLEDMPLKDATVDVVISNCVINLSGDKPKVIREAARVLRPGGRFAVSDVIADPDMDQQTRADMAAWTGCVAGALTEAEFRQALQSARLRRDRDPRDPPRPRARRRRDHPRTQTTGAISTSSDRRPQAPKPAACNTPAKLATCRKPDQKNECCARSAGDARRSHGQRQASQSTEHAPGGTYPAATSRSEKFHVDGKGGTSPVGTSSLLHARSATARSASHDAFGCSSNTVADAGALVGRAMRLPMFEGSGSDANVAR